MQTRKPYGPNKSLSLYCAEKLDQTIFDKKAKLPQFPIFSEDFISKLRNNKLCSPIPPKKLFSVQENSEESEQNSENSANSNKSLDDSQDSEYIEPKLAKIKRIKRRKNIRKINPVKSQHENSYENSEKSHKNSRHYTTYSNEMKIKFLKMATGTQKLITIDHEKAREVARELGISWSTAKSWVTKNRECIINGKCYADVLEEQGDKKKIGVGRKITYGIDKEQEILSFALKSRENEDKILTMRELKEKAKEIIGESEFFKASDGWAKKFCCRNSFIISDKFNIPKIIPTYFYEICIKI